MKTTGKWTVTVTRNGTVFSGLSKRYAHELAASLRGKCEAVAVSEPAATESELATLARTAVASGRVQMSLDCSVVTLDGAKVRAPRVALALGEALLAARG